MEIAELRQKGIQDMHLLDWNFRVAEDTPYVQMGKRYVNNWQQVKAENLGQFHKDSEQAERSSSQRAKPIHFGLWQSGSADY